MYKWLEARSLIFRFEILIFDLCGTNPQDDEPRVYRFAVDISRLPHSVSRLQHPYYVIVNRRMYTVKNLYISYFTL